jgi:hypothetical protein
MNGKIYAENKSRGGLRMTVEIPEAQSANKNQA